MLLKIAIAESMKAPLKAIPDRRPFRPIRLHITSGQYVDVVHPETALLTRSMIAVAMKLRRGVADYIVWYSLIHVAKVAPLRTVRKVRRRRRA